MLACLALFNAEALPTDDLSIKHHALLATGACGDKGINCEEGKSFRVQSFRKTRTASPNVTAVVQSFQNTPVPTDSDILAYYVWLNRYTLGTVSLSDKTDPYTSCRDVLKNQYSDDAMVEVHVAGAPTDPPSIFGAAYPATAYGFPNATYAGVGALPLADCVLWNTVTHYEWGSGTNAAKNVRTCAGPTVLFKAAVLPYKSGEGNFLGLPAHMFEVPRYAFLKAKYLEDGELQATNLVMGIAAPMNLSLVDFADEWTCGNNGHEW